MKRWLEERKRWKNDHIVAMASARQVRSMVTDIQVGEYNEPGFKVYYAETPMRAAWDAYFATMQSRGSNPWKHGGYTRFERSMSR